MLSALSVVDITQDSGSCDGGSIPSERVFVTVYSILQTTSFSKTLFSSGLHRTYDYIKFCGDVFLMAFVGILWFFLIKNNMRGWRVASNSIFELEVFCAPYLTRVPLFNDL